MSDLERAPTPGHELDGPPAGTPIPITRRTGENTTPIDPTHTMMAVGAFSAMLHHRVVRSGERFPEPPECIELWWDAVEATADDAVRTRAETKTGTIAIEDGDREGYYLRVLATNGKTLAHSEVYTGHRHPMESVADIKRALDNPKVVDHRNKRDEKSVAPDETDR